MALNALLKSANAFEHIISMLTTAIEAAPKRKMFVHLPRNDPSEIRFSSVHCMELAQSSQPERKMFVLFEFWIHIFDITSLTEPYTTFVDNLNCIMQYVIVCLCSDIEEITIPNVHKEHVDIDIEGTPNEKEKVLREKSMGFKRCAKVISFQTKRKKSASL